MTPEDARLTIDTDADIGSGIRYAVSVLEEAAQQAERERCLRICTEVAAMATVDQAAEVARRIREDAPAA